MRQERRWGVRIIALGLCMLLSMSNMLTVLAEEEPPVSSETESTEEVIEVARAALVKITPSSNKFGVEWEPIEGVEGYEIQYSRDRSFETGSKSVCVSAGYTKTTINEKNTGAPYYIRVRGYAADVYGEWSTYKESQTPTLSLKSRRGVYYLSWEKVDAAVGYDLQYRKSGGYYKTILTLEENEFVSYDLIQNGKGYYRIKPFYYDGDSKAYLKYSNVKYVNITRVKLSVKALCQYPSLPTGCEATALTMALNYHGFSVKKETIARTYMPKKKVPGDFYNYFLGDPFKKTGLGIYAPGLAKTGNNYLKKRDTEMRAYDITGATMNEICEYVAKGYPVCIWTTANLSKSPRNNATWYIKGKKYVWKSNEHCMTVIGYDTKKKTLIVANPFSGIREYSRKTIELRNKQYNRMAVVIK